ncbi:MAG: type II secretion system protein, partial [Planctomycetota bacterium]
MHARHSNLKPRHSRQGFTLIEILVAVGVLAILGTALIGLMTAAVDAWRQGEASRQVNEKLQALQRQVADDLAAAVADQAPVPDFHYALDTLWDLPEDPDDPYYIVHPDTDGGTMKTDTGTGRALAYFAPAGSSSQVVLRVRVPFVVGAA